MMATVGCAQTMEKQPASNSAISDEYSNNGLTALASYLETSLYNGMRAVLELPPFTLSLPHA
jgi:hypothetical protein